MKKITAMIAVALLISLLAIPTAAAATDIPRAQTEPVIDGVFNADEWANAWHFLLDGANPPHIERPNTIEPEYYPTWDFYTMWDPDNFYLAVVCKGDKTQTPKKMESGMDTRDNAIRGDGFQIYINPLGDYDKFEGKDANDTTYGATAVWTDFYCEYAPGVIPFTWAYDPFDGDSLDAMPDFMKEYKIGGTRNGETYTIEVKVPWKILNGAADGKFDQWQMTLPRKAGDKVIYDFHTMDHDGTGGQCRYGMTESGTRSNSSIDMWTQFTLVEMPAGKPAGKAPIVVDNEEKTEETAPSESKNPVTSDFSVVMYILAAVSSAGILAVKKRK